MFARFQIEEIDVAIHCREDYFHKAFFLFGRVIHVHQLFDIIRPFYDERLSDPAAAGPGLLRLPADVAARQFSRVNAPNLRELLCRNVRRAIDRAVAVIIAAERNDARCVAVRHIRQEFNLFQALIGVDSGAVYFDRCCKAVNARLRAVHRVRNVVWRRRRRRRCWRRCWCRRRRRGFEQLCKQAGILARLCFLRIFRIVQRLHANDDHCDNNNCNRENEKRSRLNANALLLFFLLARTSI